MRLAACALLFLLVALASLSAAAQSLVFRPAAGGAPLELSPRPGYQVGQAVLENRGTNAVRIVRVSMREGAEQNPRLPADVSVVLSRDALEELAPGASLGVEVQWRLGLERRARELYGHVVAETADGQSVALGVHAELGGVLPVVGQTPLSWLVFLPIAGIAVLALARGARYQKTRQLRFVALAVAIAQLTLLLLLAARFDVGFGRYEGNDGLQLIERAALWPAAGVEYAVGVDGASLPLLLLVPLLVAVASLVSYKLDGRLEVLWALVLLADIGMMGAACATDLALFACFFGLATLSIVSLVVRFAGAEGRAAGLYAAGWLFAAFVLLALGVHHLSEQAGPGLLADGRLAPRTLSLPELSHVDLAGLAGRVFGAHAVKVVFCAWFLGLGILAGLPPAHGWIARLFVVAPAPIGVLLVALRSLALFSWFRISYSALPEGVLWAARSLAVLGLLTLAWAALGALQPRDLGRLAARLSTMHVGLALLAMSSLTAIGVHGLLMAAVSQALTVTLLLVVAGVLRDRVGTDSLEKLGGLGRELPALTAFGGIALFGAAASPGTASFIAALLVCIGAFPVQRAFALAALLPVVVAAVAAARAKHRLFAGKLPESWRADPRLEPHGGRFPPLTRRELAALVPLAVLIVGLGLWPRPLLRLAATASLDYAGFVNPPGPMEIVRDSPRSDGSVAVASRPPPPQP